MRAFIETQLEKLSPRDKKLLTGLFMCFGMGMLLFMTFTLIQIQRAMEEDVRAAKTTLRAVQAEQANYDKAAAVLEAQKKRLELHANTALPAHVEALATEMQIQEGLKDATKGEQVVENGVETTKWKVVLKGRTYDEAVQFMLRLENSGYPLTIETARFKHTTVKRETRVDLNMDVITYKLAGV